MKAIGYFRESIEGGGTLAAQNKAFLEFCNREGYEAGSTFVEASSSNGHAPGFRQLVEYLRTAGNDAVIVVPTIFALGSSPRDAAVHFFQLEGLGARVAPITGGPDGMSALLAAWGDRDDGNSLGDRVRAAMRKKAVKGEVLGRPPYGYKVGNRRRLELIPEEAVVVRYIFRLYLHEGMGIRLIARRLNQEGLKTRRGGNWSMVSIRDILRNRAYLGTYARFGVRVPGSHPSLVSADDFRLVQDRLNARRTSFAPRVASQFLLSGMAICGYCGNKLIGVSRKQSWKRRSGEQVSNSYRYYQCESRTNQSVCSYHTRRADDLETEVVASLTASARGAGDPDAAGDGRTASENETQDIDRLRARLRTIDRRMEGYIDAAAKGRLAREKLHKLSVSAAADRLACDDALDRLEQRVRARDGAIAVSDASIVAGLLSSWDALSFSDRQQGLRAAISRVTVTDDAIALTLRT